VAKSSKKLYAVKIHTGFIEVQRKSVHRKSVLRDAAGQHRAAGRKSSTGNAFPTGLR